ncbi:RNA polymerase sigma-70 factor [Diaminobutyricibacter sp. McL0608]|uniref:RNA polymerase sigma-70 factor n=1 Tax=Leifsonia sp. McL0608 TaxID=3143537 RepID=UPI0031F2E119
MTTTDEPSSPEQQFEALRALLFSIAYRITGSVSESEDVIQEAWLRYEPLADSVRSPKSFLASVVTRIAIDELRSARVRRERYVGEWFPEPLLSDPYEDPARAAELADSVSVAALLLLERLSPLERAVFVLHEVFGFTFADVAAALERNEEACRQLAGRARRHMQDGRPRFQVDRRKRQQLADQFITAFRDGDVVALRELLAADVQLLGDNGGKAPLWGRGISGADNVARLLSTLVTPFMERGGSIRPRELNGEPGAIFYDRDGRVINTWTLEIDDGQVRAIRAVTNPDKLAHVGPVSDAWAVVRETVGALRTR